MIEDRQLIRQYAAQRSETAFAELVRRHLKMVYAATLRMLKDDLAMWHGNQLTEAQAEELMRRVFPE